MKDLMKQCAASGQMSARQIAEEMEVARAAVPAGELTDEQIETIRDQHWVWTSYYLKAHNFARAIIAADRALRQVGQVPASCQIMDASGRLVCPECDGAGTVEERILQVKVLSDSGPVWKTTTLEDWEFHLRSNRRVIAKNATNEQAPAAQPAVGDVAMPVEPTNEMYAAAQSILLPTGDEDGAAIMMNTSQVRSIWRAMSAAKPQQDAQAALAAKDAEIANLNRDADEMRQTMAAAAEEIHEHWAAHCDEEGYGPANLQRRLEGRYGVNYPGYTLGAFATLTAERDALRQQLNLAELGSNMDGLRSLHQAASRYHCLRRGQHWSVIDGIGDTLRAEKLDAAIDAAMTKAPK